MKLNNTLNNLLLKEKSSLKLFQTGQRTEERGQRTEDRGQRRDRGRGLGVRSDY